jgi:hypothetical protein
MFIELTLARFGSFHLGWPFILASESFDSMLLNFSTYDVVGLQSCDKDLIRSRFEGLTITQWQMDQ